MAFSHGKDATLVVNGRDLSPYLTNVSLAIARDTAETSVLNTNYKAFIVAPGSGSATWSATGYWQGDTALTSIDAWLTTLFGLETGDNMTYYPYGWAVGNACKGLVTLQTNYAIGSPIGGASTIALSGLSIVGHDAAKSLHGLTEETVTGNGTDVAQAASSTNGGVAYLHVGAGTAGTLDVKLQHSDLGSSWVDLTPTFTQVGYAAAPTSERIVIAAGTTVYKHLREVHTIATGPFTFAVTFCRK
ncbi:MAG: hypothetical protein V2A79_03790 [Planctomycetota bacterium]